MNASAPHFVPWQNCLALEFFGGTKATLHDRHLEGSVPSDGRVRPRDHRLDLLDRGLKPGERVEVTSEMAGNDAVLEGLANGVRPVPDRLQR